MAGVVILVFPPMPPLFSVEPHKHARAKTNARLELVGRMRRRGQRCEDVSK